MEIQGNGGIPASLIKEGQDLQRAGVGGAGAGQVAEGDREGSGSRVAVSGQARQLLALRKAVDDAPDVRADRVAALSDRISAGTYNVNGRLVAEAMVRQAAFEAVV